MSLEVRGSRIAVASATRDWHDTSWPLTLGCSHVSPGCDNCSAEFMTARAQRLARYAQLSDAHGRWTGLVEEQPNRLLQVKAWPGGPRWVFVCPTSDLLHPRVPTAFIRQAVDVMARHPEHHFGILTKRAGRLTKVFTDQLPDNVMVGVTVETQDYSWRLAELMKIRARVRWVSTEPLLERLDLRDYLGPEGLNWVVAGPETGVNARPCRSAWMRALLHQARAADVPFFTKHILDGVAHREYPT